MDRPQQSDLKFDSLTRDDLKKIQRSLKQPQFMGLLNEYMVQISDPKNKNQYDEYLRQMERQRELPKHMKIVQIKPRFCFRTFIVSQKNKKHEMKFFINMCESEYLDKPACEPAPAQDGHMGYSWKIPNSMGKIRYDQDKKGSPCQVVDIAFHPDTFMFGARKEFREMMINIALEAAERQLGERKETLSRDYVILQRVICKGVDGKPALMPMRYIDGKIYNKGEGPTNQPQRDMEGKETKLQKEINKQRQEHQKQKNKDKPAQAEQEKQEEIDQRKDLVVDIEQGVQRPKYSSIFTYPVDYSQFIDSPYTPKKKIPSAFNIQFQIPRVQSMDEVAGQTLQINDKKILLKIGQKYFIDLQLEQLKVKYVLLTASAKAKYDKKKKCLRIIIPVDQTVKYSAQNEQEQSKVQEIQEKGKVVQNQTWKNKVLDFTQPNVSVKMINQDEQPSKPALVQQIDQQDIIQEETKQTVQKVINQQDENQEEVERKAQKFSMSNYYGKQKKNVVKGQSKRIGFLFQETQDKIVLVIQMKNYKKQQIKALVVDRRQFLIQWNQNAQGEHSLSLIKYQHLKLNQSESDKIEKADLVYRVGFLAVTLYKKAAEKGKYLQKECVDQVFYQGETEQEQLQHFLDYFNHINLQENKKIQLIRQQQQKKQIQEERNKQSQPLRNEQQQRQKIIEPSQLEQDQNKSVTHNAPIAQLQTHQPRQQPLFQSIQPQFILFSASFIEILD